MAVSWSDVKSLESARLKHKETFLNWRGDNRISALCPNPHSGCIKQPKLYFLLPDSVSSLDPLVSSYVEETSIKQQSGHHQGIGEEGGQ